MSESKRRVIIAGSRSITSYELVRRAMMDFTPLPEKAQFNYVIVSGGADGVDTLGEEWADRHGVDVERFTPNWEQHGKAAGPMRNQRMAEYADVLVALWDGESSGTKNMIETALDEGLELHVYQHRGLGRYP